MLWNHTWQVTTGSCFLILMRTLIYKVNFFVYLIRIVAVIWAHKLIRFTDGTEYSVKCTGLQFLLRFIPAKLTEDKIFTMQKTNSNNSFDGAVTWWKPWVHLYCKEVAGIIIYCVNKVAPRHTSAVLTLLEGLIEMISTGLTLCVVKTHVYCFLGNRGICLFTVCKCYIYDWIC